MVVGAVVGDVQTTVAVYEGQVTVAVESADMSCTDADEVAVIAIVDGGRGIAIHGGSIGVGPGRAK